MNFRKPYFIFTLFLATVVFFSCSDTNNADVTPVIPSTESMTIDLSEFNNQQKGKSKIQAGSNFNAAIFSAGIAKLIVDVNLIIPKILISAAQNQDVETIAEGEYQWRYTANSGEDSFSVLLTAVVGDDDDVEWKFFVTSSATDPALNNFLFFEGKAEFDGTEGEWKYYDVQENEAVSQITWDIDNDGTVDLDFTVLSDRNGNKNSEIDYEFDGTVKTLVYLNGSSGETTTIEFNTETKAGFIISPNYNEGVKSCWDENLNDINCPD